MLKHPAQYLAHSNKLKCCLHLNHKKQNKQTKTIPDLEEKESREEEKKIKIRNPLKFINGGGKKKWGGDTVYLVHVHFTPLW